MIFDYVNKVVLTKPEPDLSEDDMAKIMRTTISGTLFRNIENINKVMTASNPSLEFIAEFEPHTLNDIKKELASGLPVSVWIIINDGMNDYNHSVVITGIDEDKKEISYNDPTYGKEFTISQSKFISMWEVNGARMIKTKIGGISRETLEPYMHEEMKDEQS